MSISSNVKSILVLIVVALTSSHIYAANPYKLEQDYPSVRVYKENHGKLRGTEMSTIWTAQLNDIITKNKQTKKPEIIDIVIHAAQHHISEYDLKFYSAVINCVTPTKSYIYEIGNKNNSIVIKSAMTLDSNNELYIDRKAVEGIFSTYCK